MNHTSDEDLLNDLAARLAGLWKSDPDSLAGLLHSLDEKYSLVRKIAAEPETAAIIEQMLGRLAASYPGLAALRGLHILDIACGSNTSKLPGSLFLRTLFGGTKISRPGGKYTSLFEPWFCRILLEAGADPVGIDFGDLEQESFTHYSADLGQPGALDFLPAATFDGIQDSRLFGSPEFTAQFPDPADRIAVAREVVRQEQRLLKPGGKLIHSDAITLVSENG